MGNTNENHQEHFDYLDELQASGVTNMWGAPQYLVDEFAISKRDAKEIVAAWMKSK